MPRLTAERESEIRARCEAYGNALCDYSETRDEQLLRTHKDIAYHAYRDLRTLLDEIAALREENERLREVTDGIPLDELETMCAAWKDGRVVVLPCKVGDTVYALQAKQISDLCVDPLHKEIITAKVIEITLKDGIQWLRLYSSDDRIADYRGANLGKTVFLTREAAEAALGHCGTKSHDEAIKEN